MSYGLNCVLGDLLGIILLFCDYWDCLGIF